MIDAYTTVKSGCVCFDHRVFSANVAKRDPTEFLDGFGALSRCLRGAVARVYSDLEQLGTTQAKFLRHIGKNGRMSQAELSRATDTHPALTGRALETLMERGWVRRKRNEDDRRQYLVELTAAGQRVRARVDEARIEIARRVVETLDDRDLEDFERIAQKLRAKFENLEPEAS